MQRRPYEYLCGTPGTHCSGHVSKLNHGLEGRGLRSHSDRLAAFNCHKKYLLATGYTQVGSREFAAPDGGPILILTKKSKFGGVLRNGKEGTRNQPKGRAAGGIIWLL